MPRRISRVAGLRGKEGLLRAYGIREIGQGIGLMAASPRSSSLKPWIWMRVAGDVLDIATAATGLRARNPHSGRAVATLVGLAGVTLVDSLSANRVSREARLE